ncbi:MAG: Stk1 family PASTA domain-containing Ser/Thr kinase [Clostridia bacterium]|nr:Stk1 family PASTA domain-containing Ser/Thr kinase [Clostridia bacterium]
MDQYIGKLLDNRYEILEVIGTGGMAVVYKARCHRLNRLVAIKILRDDLAQDAEFRRRFHDESQAVAMLSHPNIMAVYDVSRSSELEYIVMELIDGITLKQYMQKKGMPLNWKEALHFTTQIMKALSHAHSRGIIHRDIKPQNIMVLRDGSVKVADFGIARLASSNQNTLTQEALGSVHYISPEQARGSRIDARSDIYSAGVMLYEMLTGRLPYEGDSPVSVAIQHINSIPLAPRELNPDIPEALEAITMKAMASKVEQRYVDSEAMLADLEEFRKNPSINFDYSPADFIGAEGTDEPTQVIETSYRKAARPTATQQNKRRREEERYEDEEDDVRVRTRDRKGRDRDGGGSSAALAVGVILIFIVGIGVFLWVTFFSNLLNPVVQEYKVPDFVGKTIEEIQADKTIPDYVTIEPAESTVVSDTVPFGAVVSQDPKADEIKKGDHIVITVTLSAGESELRVPNVVNTNYRQAEIDLTKLGLDVVKEFQTDPTVTEDFVVSTTPAAGEPVAAGSQVKITVSLGPEVVKVTVPTLTNQMLDAAKKQLESLNLKVGTVTPVVNTAPKDTVVRQSFAPYTEVSEGTAINLEISLGPDGEAEVTPNVSPSTSPVPSVSPSASPTPSVPAGSGLVTKSISVDISGDGNETIQLRVECGGTVWYNNSVQRVLQKISVSISGTGTQTVNVYINDQLTSTYSVDFSS